LVFVLTKNLDNFKTFASNKLAC